MRILPLFLAPAVLTLAAQDDLPARLARIQGLSAEGLRNLQGRVAAAELPPQTRAYHEAHLAYALVIRTRGEDPKGAEALLDRTMQALEARKDAESMALLGACIGQKLGFSPMSGMVLAPKATGLFEEAARRSPGNPRVLVLHAVHVFHTPAFFGGGAKKALPLLEAGLKAAEAEGAPQDPWAPRWGRVEACAWLAIVQAADGKLPEAQATLAKAKALDPTHGLLAYAEKRVSVAQPKA